MYAVLCQLRPQPNGLQRPMVLTKLEILCCWPSLQAPHGGFEPPRRQAHFLRAESVAGSSCHLRASQPQCRKTSQPTIQLSIRSRVGPGGAWERPAGRRFYRYLRNLSLRLFAALTLMVNEPGAQTEVPCAASNGSLPSPGQGVSGRESWRRLSTCLRPLNASNVLRRSIPNIKRSHRLTAEATISRSRRVV